MSDQSTTSINSKEAPNWYWGDSSNTSTESTASVRAPHDRQVVIQALNKLKELENDWDGEGAPKPTVVTLRNANAIVSELPEITPNPSKVIPGEDGSLTLFWQTFNGRTYLTIERNTVHLLIKKARDHNVYLDGNQMQGKRLPEKVRTLLPMA